MAKKNETAIKALTAIKANLTGFVEQASKQVKETGDLKLASKGNSAANDIASLDRIINKYENGTYE